MVEEKKPIAGRHKIVMENRELLSISGVEDVLTFDEETVILETDMGMLTIKGLDLHVNRLNLEAGELELDGEIESLSYSDRQSYGKSGGSLFSKLFK